MLSISKTKFAMLLDPSSEITTDIPFKVYDDDDKVSVYHAHKYYLAPVSKVFRKRFFGSLKETKHVVDVRGTTAHAFETMIKFVYHRDCMWEQKSLDELVEVANLAEMYDIEDLMGHVETAACKVPINLGNVVEVAHMAEKLSTFSSFNLTEYLVDSCCNFLNVLDFSGLKFSHQQKNTVKMLQDRVLEQSTVCGKCYEFVYEEYCPCADDSEDEYDCEDHHDDNDDFEGYYDRVLEDSTVCGECSKFVYEEYHDCSCAEDSEDDYNCMDYDDDNDDFEGYYDDLLRLHTMGIPWL